ncbi:MAG: hypothetical protein LBJ62_08220 [Bifidobacteriaceae bacterium]|jgi:predicted amidophosphoribosyltransferase|nr:hypothetical protein [Bifidobacteriaceae bacterium]
MTLQRTWQAAADLIWSADCAGCGRELASPLCGPCRADLLGPVSRRESSAPRLNPADGGPALPVWCAAWYAGTVRHAIVAWKRTGRYELSREMTRAIARSAEAVGPVLAKITSDLVVAPVPSRLARRWSRPGGGTEALALAVAEALTGAGLPARPSMALARTHWSKDQAGQASRQRQAGREGTTLVRTRPDQPVLLVDDVLTTGATLLDAERALARAGCQTLGAVVLAVSPPSGQVPDARGV